MRISTILATVRRPLIGLLSRARRQPAGPSAREVAPEAFKDRLASHGARAARAGWSRAEALGLPRPGLVARQAGRAAILEETARLQEQIAEHGQASRAHIRAKHQVKGAALRLRQAERQHGSHSPQARAARQVMARADQRYTQASAHLYVSKILLG